MISTPSSPNSVGGIDLIRAFAQLFRPTLGIFAALAGCATVYALDATAQLQQYLLTAGVLVCMSSAAFAINDYWDVDKDKIDHPERPLPSGRLSTLQAWWAAFILFACAMIAAIPLGVFPFALVLVSTFLLWNYSHLLTYSGILGNLIVAAIVASALLLGSLVVGRPGSMLYPIGFLFCYILAKEIIWDVHDANGDRAQSIVTIVNQWGARAAFSIVWGLLSLLMGSIPAALLLLPMVHPLLFATFSMIMILSFGTMLARYQQQLSVDAYSGLIHWGRLGMLLGIIGLLGTAPPL
ncbi:MAG: geranylgeranylglycerol-phosphate geranylgeranyltransferase [Leptolyngbyaceae cyanobacterium MO_188.B28]|nr:geranylgeranylglycerol-phosphate geranylgeranyltransferase [Leptolyngbyaceae cyanobacterium MO_188.B28]